MSGKLLWMALLFKKVNLTCFSSGLFHSYLVFFLPAFKKRWLHTKEISQSHISQFSGLFKQQVKDGFYTVNSSNLWLKKIYSHFPKLKLTPHSGFLILVDGWCLFKFGLFVFVLQSPYHRNVGIFPTGTQQDLWDQVGGGGEGLTVRSSEQVAKTWMLQKSSLEYSIFCNWATEWEQLQN